MFGAPCLISVTILWNVFSGARCQKICNLERLEQHPGAPHSEAPWRRRYRSFKRWVRSGLKISSRSSAPPNTLEITLITYSYRKSYYPGSKAYVDYMHHSSSINDFMGWNSRVWGEYVQAVALQRMGRNTLFVEKVPPEKLQWTDKFIGFLAWSSALGGLVVSIPGFLILMLVTMMLGVCFESIGFSKMVETEVTPSDRFGLAKVVDECHVGKNLQARLDRKLAYTQMCQELIGAARSINLHTLLDNTGPCELYNLQHQISGSADQLHHLSNGDHIQANRRP